MELHVLASGSTGNATLLKFGNVNLLIDAGISARRIKNGLAEIGTPLETLDGVLITHEHRDHVSGLTTLMNRYRIPVYARLETWDALPGKEALPPELCRSLTDSLDIGAVRIEPFSISHDAADPVGFNFFYRQLKCSVATDLGFVTDTVKKALDGSDVIMLEANHDLDMLRNGSYPWYLKKRIMSNRGHLSNLDAGWTLARLARKSHTHVFLAHLSQENNCPEIAERTVRGILEEQGCRMGSDLTLYITYPDRRVSLI